MSFSKLPPMGMRTIKTAVAVMLCMLIFKIPHTGDPFYAAITAVICMKPTVKSSLQVGWQRIVGTFAGGLVGLGAMLLFEQIGYSLDFLIIPLFLMVVIYICVLLKLTDSITMACILVLSVTIMHKPEGMHSYIYVLNRIIETGIGIGIAVAINHGFFKLDDWRRKRRLDSELTMEEEAALEKWQEQQGQEEASLTLEVPTDTEEEKENREEKEKLL